MGVGGQHHAPAALPQEGAPVSIVEEAGWAPVSVWTCLRWGSDTSPWRVAIRAVISRPPECQGNALK
jgi:hypothetical protein